MKISAFYLLILLVGSAVVLSSCDSTSPDDPTAELNTELEGLLKDASGGQGLAFFTMPASNNYAAIPQDPKNPLTDAKVELGKALYHETALTVRPKFSGDKLHASCASCHHVDAGFQAGIPQGIGTGGVGFGLHGEARTKDPNCPVDSMDIQPIRSPSAMNVAWQPNILWNGQFGATDLNVGTEAAWTVGTPKEKNNLGFAGLETQAIAGQDVHRMDINKSIIPSHTTYQALFAAAYPELPSNEQITDITAGLAIAAYERTLLSNEAPFQRWLSGERSAMSEQELRGAIVFFGKGQCVSCHTGPALNSMAFYGLGMKDLDGPGTYGKDLTKPEHRGRGGFTGNAVDMFKFKVPQLYNLVDSRFYGHGASFHSVREVVEYKNNAVQENSVVPQSQLAAEFVPLNLTSGEIDDIVAFIENGLRDPNLSRYVPTSLPSGLCFPNNDPQTKIDIGCN
ncbi:MAG: cytochrome-c peroxidase [Ignavibacteriae bacterium]|nr:cytochrome-c peroxidase [Ignavibacteriota bacterium]MCB9214918.1 cytochrome-c peroxidase [Ignavibacteria bacterium]